MTPIALGTMSEAAAEYVCSECKYRWPCFDCTSSLWSKISIRCE